MSILKHTQFKFSKQLSTLLAILMLLSPIVSSASVLFLNETDLNKNMMSEAKDAKLFSAKSSQTQTKESCHKTVDTSDKKASTTKTVDSNGEDCCDEPCFCAQAGCHSSAMAIGQSKLLFHTQSVAFAYTLSSYSNPHASPVSPPPIS